MRVVLLLFAAFVVAGCQPSRVPPQALVNTKTVAVLVNAPATINVVQVGITVFGNERTTVDAGWPVEAMLRSAAETSLKGLYTVSQVPFAGVHKGLYGRNAVAAVRAAMVTAKATADVIVAVTMGGYDFDPYSGKSVSVDGCGIYHLEALFSTLPPRAYCMAKITLIDGRSFTALATEDLINPKSSDWYQSMNVFKEVPAVRWNTELRFSAEEHAKFQAALREAIDVAMPFTLNRMKLRR